MIPPNCPMHGIVPARYGWQFLNPNHMQTIDLTPTWEQQGGILAYLLENGNAEGRKIARTDIIEMGQHIDHLQSINRELLTALQTLHDAVKHQAGYRTRLTDGAMIKASDTLLKYA